MNKIKAYFQRQKQNMQGMTFKEKADHIWTYYKETMLVVFIVGVIVVGVLASLLKKPVPQYTCGVMSNVELTREGHAYLTNTFLEQVLKKDNGAIFLRTSELAADSEATVQATHAQWENVQSVLAQIEAKQLDYLILDNYSIQYYAEEDFYMNLIAVINEEDLAQLEQQEMLFSVREKSETTGHPVGIDISKMAFGKDCLTTEGPAYLVFIRNTDEIENCTKLWEHIKAWQPKEEKE